MLPTLVLAAGLGTRIRAVSGDLPKPLIEFGNAPILAHTLRWLHASGVREVWINLHYEADRIRAAVEDGGAFGLSVAYLPEERLLGTAGALRNMAAQREASRKAGPGEAPGGTTLVVYGDNLLRFDLTRLLRAHRENAAAATVALFARGRHPNTGIAGGRVELGADGRVLAFVEGSAVPPGPLDLVNAGVYAVEPEVLGLIAPEGATDFGRDVFPAMLERGDRLQGHVIEDDGYCLGLDTPESYAAGQALLALGRIALPA